MNAKHGADLRCWAEWLDKGKPSGIPRCVSQLCDYCGRGDCVNARNSLISYTWR